MKRDLLKLGTHGLLAGLAIAALVAAGGCRSTATPKATAQAEPPRAGEDSGPQAEAEATATGGPAAVGQSAPDFNVTDIDAKPHSLKDYRGRILVLDFWATYCKPCVEKLREYESVYQANRSKEVDFLALSTDSDDAIIKGWREENAVSIPLARMDDATREAYFGAVQFVTIPQVRIVDRKGVVRYAFGPEGTTADVEAAINALLEE